MRPKPSTIASPPRITIRESGGNKEFIQAPGQTILEAALAAGQAMPFSCGMGACGTCRARLLRGAVNTAEADALADEDRQGGYFLTCVSRAVGDVIVEIER